MMRKTRAAAMRALATRIAVLPLLLGAVPAHAVLAVGARAPDFSLDAALAGKPFRFNLAQTLTQGPVVLYFFPKAFTKGCTIEAHEFAEYSPQFAQAGASVIGVSSDSVDDIKRFSQEACRDRFPVASDAGAKVIRAYDASIATGSAMADRISYVIGRDGRIVHEFSSADPKAHVRNALQAVTALQQRGDASTPSDTNAAQSR